MRKFPGKANYDHVNAELLFKFQMGQIMVQSLGIVLQCYPDPPLTFTPRYPSMTTPSHLTDPHVVNSEDDVLHIKNLPSFDDALGQQVMFVRCDQFHVFLTMEVSQQKFIGFGTAHLVLDSPLHSSPTRANFLLDRGSNSLLKI